MVCWLRQPGKGEVAAVFTRAGAVRRLEILDRVDSAFEGVAQPVQCLARGQRYHVEAAGLLAPTALALQELLGGEDQALALAPVDALQCAAPGGMLAIANFDEYYCIAVEHDQIELATTAAPVLRQQAQAMPLQVVAGPRLGLATTVLAALN